MRASDDLYDVVVDAHDRLADKALQDHPDGSAQTAMRALGEWVRYQTQIRNEESRRRYVADLANRLRDVSGKRGPEDNLFPTLAEWIAKHFAEIVDAEIVEPRVLQYGDPEPARDTKWEDTGGNVWSYGHTCHRDYPVWRFESVTGSSFGRWDHLDSCFFPMTEVTD